MGFHFGRVSQEFVCFLWQLKVEVFERGMLFDQIFGDQEISYIWILRMKIFGLGPKIRRLVSRVPKNSTSNELLDEIFHKNQLVIDECVQHLIS